MSVNHAVFKWMFPSDVAILLYHMKGITHFVNRYDVDLDVTIIFGS